MISKLSTLFQNIKYIKLNNKFVYYLVCFILIILLIIYLKFIFFLKNKNNKFNYSFNNNLNNNIKNLSKLSFLKENMINNMNTPNQLQTTIKYLNKTLKKKIPGDIVELGCYDGGTTIFFRMLLNIYKNTDINCDKKIHVYDSFEGLPEISHFDKSKTERQFNKGDCKTNITNLKNNFISRNLKLPIINKGWFKNIPDKKYPKKISFAHFDGDLYSSIMDSFNKVYHKMSKGGIIMVDDFKWDVLPGVAKACEDFLKDKKENFKDMININSKGILIIK